MQMAQKVDAVDKVDPVVVDNIMRGVHKSMTVHVDAFSASLAQY